MEGPFPPRLVARVTPPKQYDDPYLVKLRLLNTSEVVDRFDVSVQAEFGAIPEPARRETAYALPGGDHEWVVPVLLKGQTPARLLIEARSEHTESMRRLKLVVPEDTEVDSGEHPAVDRLAADAEPAKPFALLSDHPIERGGDMFHYADVAHRMADFLLDARTVAPFTIGIQGGWGAGKSSLMGLLRQEIEQRAIGQRGLVRVAWFNAWTAEGASALTALIRSVLDQLDPSVLRRVLRRTRRSSLLTTPFVVLASLLGLRALADDLWQRFQVDASQRNQIRQEIQDAVAAWAHQNQPLGADRRLVVFIDDLDRCSPENIVQVLEAIRLYLDAPGLAFVIGYDQAIVSDALSRTRESSAGLGRAYLEKIIQVDYAVPIPDVEQSREMARACARSCGVAGLLVDEDLALIIQRSDRNPRRLKRFLNTFVLSHQLDDRSTRLRPGEHIKMLLLRMYFPELFRLLLVEPERDVLGQLIELARLRGAVRAGRDVDEQQVQWLCETTGIAQPGPDEPVGDVLARLETHAPEVVVTLSRNTDLFSLAWSLGKADQRADLLRRTRERLPTFEQLLTTGNHDSAISCGECGTQTHASQHFCPVCGTFLEFSSRS